MFSMTDEKFYERCEKIRKQIVEIRNELELIDDF